MLRRLCIGAALVAFSAAPAFAIVQPRTFSISELPASATRNDGRDAGIDVSHSSYVRVTASGELTTRYGACGHYFTPSGCGGMQGTLMAAFASAYDRPVSGWMEVGTFANLAVPFGAERLLLRINGITGREVGTYHVVADAVSKSVVSAPGSSAAATRGIGGSGEMTAEVGRRLESSATTGGSSVRSASSGRVTVATIGRSSLGTAPTVPTGTTGLRSDVQYVMRRLGFSDTPEQVTYWYTHGGVAAWLAYQLNYAAISDSSIGSYVYAMPTLTGNSSVFPDDEYNTIVENRLMQQEVATQRQLLEKVTLHWLEHFAVSENTVNSPGAMDHYIETVRADALGNFAKLVSDVSKEPAMLYWLSNNYNNGNSPTNPANQNFGRELMQLYTIGPFQLNIDGTQVLDGSGNPIETYAQSDVVTASNAVTGFQVHGASALEGAWPSYLETVQFSPGYHYTPADNGGKPLPTIFGQTISDPGGTQCAWNGTNPPGQAASGPCVVDNLVNILASQPTTCAFEAKEMIERLANEVPSPAYVSRVANVWCENLTASNQIALVVNAIGSDPEFLNGKYEMVKEPIELEVDTIRALRGAGNPVSANPIVGQNVPLSGPVNDSGNMQQRLWYPPTVFSFYYPGQKESLMNNVELLARWSAAADLGSDAFTVAPSTPQDTSLNLTQLAPAGANATTAEVNRAVNYLLDALVDGGTPELKTLLTNYMMNYRNNTSPTAGNSFQNGLKGAIWMVITSPEDEGKLTMLFSRRNFLCGSSAVAFSSSSFMRLLAQPAQAASGNTIVIVYEFNGGNDGFNMIVPLDSTNFPLYTSLRSNIAVPMSAIETAQTYFDATPSAVGTGSTYGFNPVMTELRSLYAQGKVAIVSGVGLEPSVQNRQSHQQGQYYWASGSVSDTATADLGWVGLAFDKLGGSGNISPMVAVNGSLPIAMIGVKSSPLVVGGDLGGFQINTGYAGSTNGGLSIKGNDAYATSAVSAEFARSVANQTTNYISVVQAYAKAVNPDQTGGGPLSGQYPATPAYPPYNLKITYPGGTPQTSGVKIQMAQIARLILGGAPTRSYYVRQGGYDTHGSEVAQQPLLLQEFSEAVSEFYAYLKGQGASSNVIIMTTSEFGRLPFSNASAGTDHGTASFHFIIGDPVTGGLYGTEEYPNLTPGLSGNYVGVDIDFRYQLSIAIQYLGVDPEIVLGTSAFTTLSGAGANLQNIIA